MSDSAKSKTAAPLPNANETNRLGDAAPRAAPNRHPKKRKSLKPKARHTARYGYAAPVLLPPNLHTIGPLPFSAQDFATLDTWLAEDGWPDAHMDVAMLEGYLVALLVWPIELAPGAWLPRIWGIRGWKVAAKISTPEKYNQFVALVIGLFQELELRLATSPPARTFVLGRDAPYMSGRYFAGAAWATGFITALHENSRGLGSRSAAVRSAVEDIAQYASLRSQDASALPPVATALSVAMMVIMSERPTRGQTATVPLNKAPVLHVEKRLVKSPLETSVGEVSERVSVINHATEQKIDETDELGTTELVGPDGVRVPAHA